jgi:phosphatidate phosphatase APP1
MAVPGGFRCEYAGGAHLAVVMPNKEEHMSGWLDTLTRMAHSVETRMDAVRYHLKLRNQWLRPLEIQTYRGHGTADTLYLKGRVLECTNTSGAGETDSVWENIVNMYRRFASDEIPGARLRVRGAGTDFEAHADHEGYFDLQIRPVEPLTLERVWHEVELELLEPRLDGQEPVRAVGHVLVPPPKTEFGVISDIDDTIVRTGATDPLTMARIVVLNNPHTRLPFEGVAAFYQALRKGPDGEGYNPIFYVSSSPWNLYDLLIDFMNINGIPLGPLFLRDVGLEEDRLIKTGHLEHKMKQIRTILETHPDLPFVLIGDSGQEDPEIYREVVREYPGRIQAIYIRDVTLDDRARAIQVLVEDLRSNNVELVLTPDTVAAASHAAERGLIAADALPAISIEKGKDEQAPTIVDQLPIIGDGGGQTENAP